MNIVNYEDMYTGLEVRVRLYGGKMARATIKRVHRCWSIIGTGSIVADSLRSDDKLPAALDCEHGTANRPRTCVHVRYRNNQRAIVGGYTIHALNAVDELAKLVS